MVCRMRSKLFGDGLAGVFVLVFFACNLVCCSGAHAESVKAASCSQRDVQDAIDAARGGDVVEVPAGTARWVAADRRRPAVLISGKVITLRGAGMDQTVITDGNTVAWQDLLIWIQGEKPARVTGFTFEGSIDRNRGAAAIAVRGDCRNWRIDHCRFRGSPRGVWAYGGCFGLVDNCSFLDVGQGVVMKGHGSRSWERPLALGLPEAVYIEDCSFRGGGSATDGYHGARFAFRHNLLVDTHVAQHGCDSGGYRSTFSYEVYDNVISKEKLKSWEVPRAMHLRGGTGVVFNNKLIGYTTGIDVANYRSSEALRELCGKWGLCDGKNPIDGNEEPNGYPSRDQIGRSTHQLLEPLYEWNNTLDGQDADIHVSTGVQHIEEGRDFHNDSPRPGYKPYAYPHPLRGRWPLEPPQDEVAPAIPQNLTVRQVSDRQIELTWKASADTEGTVGYYVWLNGKRITTVTDPSHARYTFTRLRRPTAQLSFSVSAFDAAGNESQPSPAGRAEERRR